MFHIKKKLWIRIWSELKLNYWQSENDFFLKCSVRVYYLWIRDWDLEIYFSYKIQVKVFLVRNKHTHINLIRHLFKKKEYTLNYQWNKVAQFKFRFSLDGGEYGRTNKLIFCAIKTWFEKFGGFSRSRPI